MRNPPTQPSVPNSKNNTPRLLTCPSQPHLADSDASDGEHPQNRRVYFSPAFSSMLPDKDKTDPSPTIKSPRHLTNVLPPTENFVGREESLQKISTKLKQGGRCIITHSQEQHENFKHGGVGKTQLAREFARRAHHTASPYSFIRWIQSDSVRILDNSFIEFARALGIDVDEVTDKHLIPTVLNWLKRYPSWLIIFDNVTRNIEDYLPDTLLSSQHIIVTTRDATNITRNSEEPLQLGELTSCECLDYVKKYVEGTTLEEAATLNTTVQGLPLSLSNAAHFMAAQQVTVTQYLATYLTEIEERVQTLERSVNTDNEVVNYADISSAAITCALTAREIQKIPAATLLLDYCVYLSLKTIPLDFIEDLLGRDNATLAINTLQRYALTQNDGVEGVRLHKLHQDKWPQPDPSREQECLLSLTNGMIEHLCRFDEEAPETWEPAVRLFHHARKMLQFSQPTSANKVLYKLNFHVARVALHQTLYDTSVDYNERAIKLATPYQKEFRKVAERIAQMKGSIAMARGAQGKHDEQRKQLEKVLTEKKLIYGKQDVEVAITLVNLGTALEALGLNEEREKCLIEALAIAENLRETTHSVYSKIVYAKILSCLGNAQVARSRVAEGKNKLENALVIFGDAQPLRRARTMQCLVNALGKLGGEDDRRKQYAKQSLTLYRNAYGDIHPRVATALETLAIVVGDMGEPSQRLQLLLQALDMKKRLHHPQHPELAKTLGLIGNTYGVLGEPKTQLQYIVDALIILVKTYNNDHPIIAKTLGSKAGALGALGRLQEKKALLEETLAMKRRVTVYGELHYETAKTKRSLGEVCGELAQYEQQRQYLKKAQRDFEKIYAQTDHPSVAKTLAAKGIALRQAGRIPKAKTCLRKAIKYGEQKYVPDHISLAKMYCALGATYGMLKKHDKQEQYLARAERIFRNKLGINHPEYAATLACKAEHAKDTIGTEEQRKLLAEAHAILVACYGEEHIETAKIKLRLLAAKEPDKKWESVQQEIEISIAIIKKALSDDHPEYAICLRIVGETCLINSKPKLATKNLRAAKEIFSSKFSVHPEIATINIRLSQALSAQGDSTQQQKDLLEEARNMLYPAYDTLPPELTEINAQLTLLAQQNKCTGARLSSEPSPLSSPTYTLGSSLSLSISQQSNHVEEKNLLDIVNMLLAQYSEGYRLAKTRHVDLSHAILSEQIHPILEALQPAESSTCRKPIECLIINPVFLSEGKYLASVIALITEFKSLHTLKFSTENNTPGDINPSVFSEIIIALKRNRSIKLLDLCGIKNIDEFDKIITGLVVKNKNNHDQPSNSTIIEITMPENNSIHNICSALSSNRSELEKFTRLVQALDPNKSEYASLKKKLLEFLADGLSIHHALEISSSRGCTTTILHRAIELNDPNFVRSLLDLTQPFCANVMMEDGNGCNAFDLAVKLARIKRFSSVTDLVDQSPSPMGLAESVSAPLSTLGWDSNNQRCAEGEQAQSDSVASNTRGLNTCSTKQTHHLT